MSTEKPLVSVIIPAYKVIPYIAEAVQSVLGQTYTAFEAIVVDSDRNEEMAKALEPFRGRFVHLQAAPAGLSAARNLALRHARGSYIALLDGDDYWMPNYLETMVGILEANREIDVVYPNAYLFGDPKVEGKLFQDLYPSVRPVTLNRILTRECHVHVAATFRRSLLEKVTGFDEELKACEDLDMWIRMSLAGARFDLTTEPLLYCRRRANSLTTMTTAGLKYEIRVYRQVAENTAITAATREIVRARLDKLQALLSVETSKSLILEGSYDEALRELQAANAQLRRPKLSAAALALRVAPGLVARVMRHRSHEPAPALQ